MWAESGNRLIIEDDFDSEFTLLSKPEDTLYSLSRKGHVIYMNTFSKTIAPSVRMGYVAVSYTHLTGTNYRYSYRSVLQKYGFGRRFGQS